MHGHLLKWSIILVIVSKSAEVCQGSDMIVTNIIIVSSSPLNFL